MSNLKYATVEEEVATSSVSFAVTDKNPKPFVVSRQGSPSSDTLTRRVEAALEADFANGSMPA
jgi:hypothetical protein